LKKELKNYFNDFSNTKETLKRMCGNLVGITDPDTKKVKERMIAKGFISKEKYSENIFNSLIDQIYKR
jgi:hypothetical protein